MLKTFFEKDYIFKTLVSSAFATLVGLGFTIFNGVLGILYQSIWHGTICVYYVLLALVRAILLISQKNITQEHTKKREQLRKIIYICTHLILIVVNLALIIPISIMVKGQRPYHYGLIPAIAMGIYTIYRIVFGVIHFKKTRTTENIFVAELRTINLFDALVAILTFQNTLIMTNGGMNESMMNVSAGSSAIVLGLILFITIKSFMIALDDPKMNNISNTNIATKQDQK